jgi:sister-chromatid-cohesion protein PDS5
MYSVLMCGFLFIWNFQQLVKRYTMERMAEIFRVYCVKSSDGSINPGEYDWIPGRILRCLYDKDFRQDFLACVLTWIY